MIREKKKLLIGVAATILIGIGIYGMHEAMLPNSINHEFESTYSPMLLGPLMEITFEHYLHNYPWYHYFGTDLNETEVLAALQEQNPIKDRIYLEGEKDSSGRYLFKIGESAPYGYQELYVIPQSFFGKAEYSYLLYDGCLPIKSGETEAQILFPFGILDYDWESFMEVSGPMPQEDNIWKLKEDLSEIKGSLIDFLTKFYDESILYHVVSQSANELGIIIDESYIQYDQLNQNEWRRGEHIYRESFKIILNEENGTVRIMM